MGRRKKTDVAEIKLESEPTMIIDPEVTEEEVKPKNSKKTNATSEYSGSYKVTAVNLNLRSGAGKDKSVVAIMPKDTIVVCSGESKIAEGKIWLFVSVSIKGKLYEGYCMEEFLIKR